MSLISSAQNNEDVMLWRALKGVLGGFYIDVGAADPVDLSVTKLFYDRGWCGINIEPDPDHFARLREARPRDVNLDVAAASQSGELAFQQVVDTGLSTLDSAIADRYRHEGRIVRTIRVASRPLADICAQYRSEGDIHFLKVDVEGAEAEVLRGADLQRFRPWIILLEATAPSSTVPVHENWESSLLQQAYRFAWFDGLNRFYLAEERASALGRHFQVQPNIFDGFSRPADILVEAESSRKQAEGELRLETAARERAEAAMRVEAEARLRAEAEMRAADEARQRAETSLAIAQSLAATIQAFALSEQAARQASNLRQHRAEARLWAAEAHSQATDVRSMQAEAARSASDAAANRLAERATALEQAAEQAFTLAETLAAGTDGAPSVIAELARREEQTALAAGLPDNDAIRATIRAELQWIRASRLFADALIGSTRRAELAENLHQRLRSSTIWRVTRPLRGAVYVLRGRLGLRDTARVVRRSLVARIPVLTRSSSSPQAPALAPVVPPVAEVHVSIAEPASAALPAADTPPDDLARLPDLSPAETHLVRVLMHRARVDAVV